MSRTARIVLVTLLWVAALLPPAIMLLSLWSPKGAVAVTCGARTWPGMPSGGQPWGSHSRHWSGPRFCRACACAYASSSTA